MGTLRQFGMASAAVAALWFGLPGSGAEPAAFLLVKGDDLQSAIDAAPAYAVLVADRARQIEVSSTVRIAKPLTLVGLNARLKAGIGNAPLIEVAAEGVRIRDFLLTGNADTVSQKVRAPLILVQRGRFVIEDGETNNSSKDGVMITPAAGSGDIEHGVIRNLIARGTVRDAVSIGGVGEEKRFVRHLVVENIGAYASRSRGAVEASDGSEYITVRDVYAESCAYGMDIQDHSRPGQVNRYILIDGLHVKNTPIAIRMDNWDFGHNGLTIRNVTGTDWPARTRFPLDVRNTANVLVENVRLYDVRGEVSMRVQNCANVTLRNLTFTNSGHDGPALLVEDVDGALIDNVVVQGKAQPEFAVLYRINSDRQFGGLRIRNVLAEDVRGAGIVLENRSRQGRLKSCVISDNLATVRSGFKAEHMVLRDNVRKGME